MTRDEFIRVLNQGRYSYKIEGDNLVVISGNLDGDIDIRLEEIPGNIFFNNKGTVRLNFLKQVPSGVEFKNLGRVHLDSVTSLHPSVRFNNLRSIWLGLYDDWVNRWDNNIEGIDENALFNLMIKRGLFI